VSIEGTHWLEIATQPEDVFLSISPIPLDVISDVMCPWCYIGKRRLEKALAATPDHMTDVRWRPYQLDATIPVEGMDRQEYLNRKFGGPEGVKQVYDPVRAAGEAEDIPFNFEGIKRSPNTLNAHRVIRWAQTTGHQDDVVERLFQLYFLEGADLTDHTVLIDAAWSVGMEKELVERLLNSDADVAETREEIALAQKMGVTGVPTFIVGNKYAVVGAQGADILAKAIVQVAQEMAADAPLPVK
jgi:predicted DsbA family dithiol-disulfide isomerase